MAISPRLIKRRIRSVNNTRKITRAMELVAASKMRKAVQMTLSSRDYSRAAEAIVADIRQLVDAKTHPLLAGRPQAKTSLVMVVGSNRGLCGGFNAQVLKKSIEFLARRTESDVHVVTIGRKTEIALKRAKYPIVASFESIADAPHFEKTRPVGSFAYTEFMQGRVDRVFLVYTNFVSALSQVPQVKQLLPIIPEEELQRIRPEEEEDTEDGAIPKEAVEQDTLFEPDPKTVLDAMLPRLLETEIYQALLESAASEHSARMMAMRNATENATEMMEDLTFTFNQARQASITREISEISAGKAAIE